MSVWKKASKVNQKVHRERSQPEARKKFGFLEKHIDYKKRAVHHSNQNKVIKALHKKALDKNPDEFYYHMINSKTHNGEHHELEKKEDTPEQIQLMHSQDIKYIQYKRTQEHKKIERLQAELHLSSVQQPVTNRHKRFKKNLGNSDTTKNDLEHLTNLSIPNINIQALKQATKKRKETYVELAKRIERERELNIIQQKLYIKKELNSKNVLKPKKVRKGNKDSAPIYKWRYERKR